MKKIGILFTVIIMAMLFVVSASAATEGYYTYEVENGEAIITEVDRSISGDVTIPSTLGGYSVTSIRGYAFSYCRAITSIRIPDSVTSINSRTFNCCDSLTSIIVDKNNKYYSNDSNGVLFNKDKTELIEYPAGKVETKYVIPGSVISIKCVFENCYNLRNITIPDSVTIIGYGTFSGCTNLMSITVGENNKNYSNDSNGVLFNKDKTELIKYPAGITSATYTIPYSVTTIGAWAFSSCFNLTSVTIPDSVTIIGYGAFKDCYNLISITIPDSVASIDSYAFEGTAYYNNDSNWENSVLYINNHLIDAKTDISDTYTIKDGTKLIASSAFSGCVNLTSIIMPDSVLAMGSYAFFECSNLKEITISKGVSEIEWVAFANCSNLETITIPASVTTIEQGAFNDCYNLADVYYCGAEEQWEKIFIMFGNESLTNSTIYYNYCHSSATNIHNYTPIVIPPICTENGYTIYTCECGYSYESDFVNKTEHSYVASDVVAPTCEGKGYTVYICECGSSKKDNYIDKTGHKYVDQKCEICGKKCSCNCHKSGFMGFIWKIILFFNKLFKTNRACACGISHY